MSTLLGLALLLQVTTAFSPNEITSPHAKFNHWYPFFRRSCEHILQGYCEGDTCIPGSNCSAVLAAYRNANHSVVEGACYKVYDCLSAGLYPHQNANLSSASVLLGLAPWLLQQFAPSIGDISLLTLRRWGLALLTCLGTPVVNVSRHFEYNDPLESIDPVPTAFIKLLTNLKGWKVPCALLAQYLLVAAAVANVFMVAWQLGIQTINPWKCNEDYLPLLWTVLPVLIHTVGALGWSMSTRTKMYRDNLRRLGLYPGPLGWEFNLTTENDRAAMLRHLQTPTSSPNQSSTQRTTGTELTTFGPKPTRTTDDHMNLNVEYPPGTIKASFNYREGFAKLLNELAGFGAFIHIVAGTLIYSSLGFIGTIDATLVIGRYILSGLVCRFVITWELASFRSRDKDP